MSKRKKNYTTEFKTKAVELTYLRGSVKKVSDELGIPYLSYIDGGKNLPSMVKTVFQVVGSQNLRMGNERLLN